MQDFIMLLLNAGDGAIQSGIQAGLDIVYGNIKVAVEESETMIDNKVLEIVVNAIKDWEPKNV
jgi:hypothetical protein